MILLNNITKEYGDKTVLNSVSLSIYDGERVAIIGNNGEGKTTLLNIITQKSVPDCGSIQIDGTISYLKQSSEIDIQEILSEISKKEIATDFEYFIKKLGVSEDINLLEERLEKISPGEKTKIALAFCLAKKPTTLILDEPTNHLDQKGKELLIKTLDEFWGTVVFVSHDKDFLNRVAQKIVELKCGKITEYDGNYDDYKQQKENNQLCIQRNYEKHIKEQKEIKSKIEKFQEYAKKVDAGKHQKSAQRAGVKFDRGLRADVVSSKFSRRAKDQISKLESKLSEDVEKPEKQIHIRYKLNNDEIKTKFFYIAENLSKKFGGRTLFEGANFTIENGAKIALLGDNGVGKTTLINILLGKESFDGTLRTAPSVKPVLMRQDLYDLDEDLTINEMSQQKDKEYRTSFITNLCSMNIDKSRFNTKIKFLSSGEKMRIKLCEIILSDFNFLILDEPTNHLDILNKDYLETVLKGFSGTMLVVSHDKSFVKAVTNQTLLIENKTIKQTK